MVQTANGFTLHSAAYHTDSVMGMGEGGTYDILGLSLCYLLCLARFLLFST